MSTTYGNRTPRTPRPDTPLKYYPSYATGGETDTVHTFSNTGRGRGGYQTQAVGLESEADTTAVSVNWSDVTAVTSSAKAGTGNCCRIVAVPFGTNKLNLVAMYQRRNCHCSKLHFLKTYDNKQDFSSQFYY